MTLDKIKEIFISKFNDILIEETDKGYLNIDTSIGRIILNKLSSSGKIIGTFDSEKWNVLDGNSSYSIPNPILYETEAIVVIIFPKGTTMKIKMSNKYSNVYIITEDNIARLCNTIKRKYGYKSTDKSKVKSRIFSPDDLLKFNVNKKEDREFNKINLKRVKRSSDLGSVSLAFFLVFLISMAFKFGAFALITLSFSVGASIASFTTYSYNKSIILVTVTLSALVVTLVLIAMRSSIFIDIYSIFNVITFKVPN